MNSIPNDSKHKLLNTSLVALEFDSLREELARLAESDPGREMLSEIMPSSDVVWARDEIRRVDEIKDFMDRGGSFMSGGTADLRTILKKAAINGVVLSEEDLLSVLHHLKIHKSVRKILDKEQPALNLVHRLARPLTPLPYLESKIDFSITPDATVRDRASTELARIRRAIMATQLDIRKKISAMVARFSKMGILRGDSFTIRDGRYVLPVRSDSFKRVRGIIHDRSTTGGTIFVEPTAVIDIGNEFRSLELAERDEVRRILREISDYVHKDVEAITRNLHVLTSLDCLWAKARFADLLDAYPPIISENKPLRIVHGRHPLLILSKENEVVPLNLELGVDWTCLVISGPNAGGKSVALKCAGLLSMMAACGLHVPALPGTELPLYENYHAVIGDQQSISDDLSTFSAHTMQLKEILQQENPRSLILVDEIGAGTDPQEGASLSIAVLEQLIARKIPTIVTTHHGALKAFAHSTPGCANGSMAFNHENFEPSYIFQPNLPGSSYALDIARRVGLPAEIISRAREILGKDRTQLDDLIHDMTEKVRKYDDLVQSQEKQSAEAEGMEKAYREKLNRLKVREKEQQKRTRSEVEAVVKEARRSIEALVKEIRESSASREAIKAAHGGLDKIAVNMAKKTPATQIADLDEDKPAEISKSNKKRKSPAKRKREKRSYDRPPEVGDWVMIDDGNTKAEVISLSSRADRVCITMGSIQLWINVDRVKIVEPPSEKIKTITFTKVPKVPLELDIRGLDAPEAINRVDRYLFDGSAQGREQLGIIHGKGKGILSKYVREHLKNHKVVESFRFGEYGEGDYGLTVVNLKKPG